jgi:hypothetical protein
MKTAIRPPFPVDDRRTYRPVHSLSNHPAHVLLAGEKAAISGINEPTGEA